MKTVLKRFLALTLAFLMMFTLMPAFEIPVYAATSSGDVTGLSNDKNIGLSYTSDNGNPWSASGTTVTGSIQSTSGSCGATHYQSTLTITNKRSITAELSFDYIIDAQGGTIQVDGTAVTAGGYFSKELAAGGTVDVCIKSGSTSAPTKITLRNIALVANVTATTTFLKPEHGSYTVDGETITEETTKKQDATKAYKLAATPDAGYQFRGWYNYSTQKYIGIEATVSYKTENDATIAALFVPDGASLFENSGQVFDELGEAIAYAQTNDDKIISVYSKSATLSHDYTIPTGITLLVPFDANKTCYTTTPVAVSSAPPAKPYRTLTLTDGASLVVKGAVSIGGQYYAAGGSEIGKMVGTYGHIILDGSSSIIVKGNGALYAWGFVSGSGSVTVEDGGNVYEWYQILDFRGGSASMGMGNSVFPFSQYAVQNVEVPLTLMARAKETVYTAVYASKKINPTAIPFVGDSGMFQISRGSLTKAYDGSSDRIIYTVDGDAKLKNLSLKLMGMTVDSTSYVLPLTNNMTVNLTNGSTLAIDQNTALLAGVQANIAQGATLDISNGKKVYVYDADEWNANSYTCKGKFVPVQYAPSKTYTRSEKDLVDASVWVNGTLTANGSIYTTENGANISSDGGGQYNQAGAPGTETVTYQYTQSGSTVTSHDIPITPAKLLNADGSFTETAKTGAGTIFEYIKGKWKNSNIVVVHFMSNDGTDQEVTQEITKDTPTNLDPNTFSRTGYEFVGWNTEADGSGKSYEDGESITFSADSEDLPLYAQWKIKTFTVTWKADEDTVLLTEEIQYGEHPEHEAIDKPNRIDESGQEYRYAFAGWLGDDNKKLDEKTTVTADVTYTAQFDEIALYTVTWKNGEEVLSIEKVDAGTIPVYKGTDPVKDMDNQYRYAFAGWGDENGTPIEGTLPAVSANVTYTACFNPSKRVFKTVTFDPNYGEGTGEGTMEPQKFEVGYETALNQNGFTRVGYTFAGWNKAADGSGDKVADLNGISDDITLYAQWEVVYYTVTWVDEKGNELKKLEGRTYGEAVPTYDGEKPTKAADARYTYEFAGWDPSDVTTVTGNIIFRPKFNEILNKYTITWQNEDGTVLETQEVGYGSVPEYHGATPEKAGDAQYSYSFAGWTPTVTDVTCAATYTATFTQQTNQYTVTWVNWDDTVLQEAEEVEYGTRPVYRGETPVKPGNAQYTYQFAGWTPTVTEVTGAITYKATFTSVVNQYTVKWVNFDGTELATETYAYGTTPKYSGAEPVRAADAAGTYTFKGWDKEVAPVTSNVTYTAQYECTPTSYTVTWKNGDDVRTQEVKYGDMPEYSGDTPTKEATVQYTYTFSGWNTESDGTGDEIKAVTGPVTYYAQFTAVTRTYTITWKNEDGSVLATDTVAYGEKPQYTGTTPEKTGDAQYSYEFIGWDKEVTAVTGEAVYTAVFEEITNTYTVRWVNWDFAEGVEGKEPLETDENVSYGEKPEFNGENPTREAGEDEHCTYEFMGWANIDDEERTLIDDSTKVEGDVTYVAVFEKHVDTFTVRWLDWNGTPLKEAEVEYGATPVAPDVPPRAPDAKYRYAFTGWDHEIVPATEDTTYIAVYSSTARVFHTITFHANDGTDSTATQTLEVGVDTQLIANPFVRENYAFKGWNTAPDGTGATYADQGAVLELDGDLDLYAQWQFQNGWLTEAGGTTYYRDGEKAYYESWQEIDGNTYYFDENGYIVKGIYEVVPEGGSEKVKCVFNDSGVFQSDANGVYDVGDDSYWVNNGVIEEYPGLKQVVDENGHIHYYYFGEDCKAVKDGNYKVEKNNGLKLPEYSYAFDKNGVIIHDEDTSKNGICEGDSSKFYYIDGVKVGEGLLCIDGKYYYARTSNGEIVHGRAYYVSKTNGLPPKSGTYNFNEDGVMLLSGFVTENDSTYYYDNGVIVKGFTKVYNDYYFFNAGSGKMYKDSTLWVNGGSYDIEGNWHYFGPDGKMLQTGFVNGGGATYYYADNKLAKGFTKIGDDYYLFNAGSGKMYSDATMWVGDNSYGFKGGMYYFGADGKMVIPDIGNGKREIITDANGDMYFAIDGAYMNDGLYKLDEDYYYAQPNSKILVSKTIWLDKKNGLLPEKGNWYEFDADGKMVKTGFVTGGDGYTYYYDATELALGFTKVGEDYYFFNAGSGKMYKDVTLWVGSNSYGIEGGMYYFGADGKMQTK